MDLTKIDINKYRIKTEKEFEKEFGKNWRDELISGFPGNMNFLLDCKLSNVKIVGKQKETIFIENIDGGTWNIDKDMIKKNIDKKKKVQWI